MLIKNGVHPSAHRPGHFAVRCPRRGVVPLAVSSAGIRNDFSDPDPAAGGTGIADTDPAPRDIATKLRTDALYFHVRTMQTMDYVLRMRRDCTAVIAENLSRAVVMLGWSERLARWPKARSGGQRQRAAMARVVARQPSLLLSGEPPCVAQLCIALPGAARHYFVTATGMRR